MSRLKEEQEKQSGVRCEFLDTLTNLTKFVLSIVVLGKCWHFSMPWFLRLYKKKQPTCKKTVHVKPGV